MARVINKTKGFGTINRDCVFDNQLSDRARFVYVYMACKPETWDFYQDKVAEELGYKKDTLRKYLDELIVRGWLTEKEQQNDGKFGCLEYVIEVQRKKGNLPIRKKPDTEKNRIGKSSNHINIDNISSDINISSDKRNIDDNKRLSNDNQKDELFEKFWADYGRKGTKGNALKEWNKLKDKDKNQLISNTPKYIIYCKRSNRAIKDASTFIHQRCFDEDWDIIPDYYQVQEADSERQARFKNYMVSRFKDLIYHRNPLTYEEATELLEQYEADQFEWAMERLTKRNIHQYYSIKSAINKIMQEEDFDG